MYMTGFACLACEATYPADFDGYLCPDCGGNLDVTYDYELIRKHLDHEAIFPAERADAFRFKPFLPIRDIDLAPPLRIGMTPLYHAPRLGETIGLNQLYLKDEAFNPSHSFKDRASAIAITRARETGAQVVAGASTGNAGSSMACMAASVQMPCVVFVPEKAPAAKIAQLLIYGANVIAVRGTYDQAFDLCFEVCREKGWFNRNTGYNPFTREGKKTCSFEICEQFDWRPPDRVVVATGDGNIISGIWKGMRDLYAAGLIKQLPRIDCAQAEGSSAISRAVQKLKQSPAETYDWSKVRIEPIQADTIADSISVDLPRDGLAAVRAVIESGGNAVTVPDDAILASIAEIARRTGVFAEPSAATTWACVKKMVEQGLIQKDERVVCLLTGSGLKDIANARKVAGEPTLIDPEPKAALDALGRMGLG